jgi:hypothetical protein
MRWYRWNQRWTSYAALFALALQLAVSFGHVHPGVLGLDGSRVVAAQKPSPVEPAGTLPDRDEGCTICAIIGLAGTPLLPDAPALVFAGTQHVALFSELIAVFVSDPNREHFQARARQQHVPKVPLPKHNDMVNALPPDRTDQPFGIGILPRPAAG